MVLILQVQLSTQQMFTEKKMQEATHADVTVPHKEKTERFIGLQSLVAQGMVHVELNG
jgi:hypothetical protein